MMKAKDIKKLTGEGRYISDIQLDHLKDKIRDWQANLGLQLNPDFQRGHVWTEQQQIAFVEFILRGGRTTPIQFNHPQWMNSFKGEFVCVDGLQRLTALLRFLDNDLPVFEGNRMNDIEDLDVLLRRTDVQFRINDLKTRADVLTWYLEMNTGGTVHTKDEISKVMRLLIAEQSKTESN